MTPAAHRPAPVDDLLVPVYLVTGGEALRVRERVARVLARALEGGPAAFNLTEGSASDPIEPLLSVARTPPMLGPRRAVAVREIEKAGPAALDALSQYLAAACPSTVLLLHGQSVPDATGQRGRRLKADAERVGRVERYDPKDQDPVGFVEERVQAGGCGIGRHEAELLVTLVGRDLGHLAVEVDKLLAWMRGTGRITAAHVEEVCSLLGEAVTWDLTDAIVRQNAGRALGILHRLMEEGQPPEKVLPVIAWQVRTLLALQACLRRGGKPWEEGIRMPRDKMEAARRSLDAHPLRADRIFERLARANRDMHGHRAGDRHVLERLVLGLCTRSGGPGPRP
ncbi:MAG: DNA polymerase III subunit delta [Deltaproteobacteria bacterium]|nr:DNA polymerase III subunit delta [Deltaproteobacteria bacterium]